MLIPSRPALPAYVRVRRPGISPMMQSGRYKMIAAVLAVFLTYMCTAAGDGGISNFDCLQAASAKESSEVKKTATSSVTAVLVMQAAAWNRGDLDTFLTGYLNGPETSYVSGSSEVWGYDALHARYKSKYGDNHETMGTLTFSQLKVQDLGRHNALCVGHWHLDRSGQPPVEGIFSLVFVHTDSGWKIMHDHTSVSSVPKSAYVQVNGANSAGFSG